MTYRKHEEWFTVDELEEVGDNEGIYAWTPIKSKEFIYADSRRKTHFFEVGVQYKYIAPIPEMPITLEDGAFYSFDHKNGKLIGRYVASLNYLYWISSDGSWLSTHAIRAENLKKVEL